MGKNLWLRGVSCALLLAVALAIAGCGGAPGQAPEVSVCPGTAVTCAGNVCCPGMQSTNFQTFPCPSADPGWNQCGNAGDQAKPFVINPKGGACSGGAAVCEAPGWVYCQDARCSEPVLNENGILVAKCFCYQPPNVTTSIIPKGSNAGASCVMNQLDPRLKLPAGGTAMCNAIKNGALISTYGPEAWKPPLVVAKCPARTPWAWCWGAPCTKDPVKDTVVCDCPMMISATNDDQYLSLSVDVCNEEGPHACTMVHNSSPPGPKDPQRFLTPCEPAPPS